jgi:hypothetical protein
LSEQAVRALVVLVFFSVRKGGGIVYGYLRLHRRVPNTWQRPSLSILSSTLEISPEKKLEEID